jgi:hypothetical protein
MVAPFPPEVNNANFNQAATEIYRNYTWLAKLSGEIGTDPMINCKKLGMLAYGTASHCSVFAQLTGNPSPELVAAVQDRFSLAGIEWPTRQAMRDDLLAIRAAGVNLYNFTTANIPEAQHLGTRMRDAQGVETEVTNAIPKDSHPVLPLVEALRACFGAVPA